MKCNKVSKMSQKCDKVGSNVSSENSNEPAFNDHVLPANVDVFTGLHSKCQSGQMLVCTCQCNGKNVSGAYLNENNPDKFEESDCMNFCVSKCSCAVVPQVPDSATASHVSDSVAVSLVGDSATAAQQCDDNSAVVAHVDGSAVATHVYDTVAPPLVGDTATASHVSRTMFENVKKHEPSTGFACGAGVVADSGVSVSHVSDSVTGPPFLAAATVPCDAVSAGAHDFQELVRVTNGGDISVSQVSDSDTAMPTAEVTHTNSDFCNDVCHEGTAAPPGSARPLVAPGPTRRMPAPDDAWDPDQTIRVNTTLIRPAQVQSPDQSVAVVQSHKCECCETKIVHCNIYEYLAQDSDAECSKSDDDDLDMRIRNLWLEQPSKPSKNEQVDWCASEPIYFNRLLSRAGKWGKAKHKHSGPDKFVNMSKQVFPADVLADSQDNNVVHITDGEVQATGHDSVPVTQPCNVQAGTPVSPGVCGTGGGMYNTYLDVKIGNVSTSVLMDTGATVSCISSDMLHKIHPRFVKYSKPDIVFISGVGNKHHQVTDLVEISFKINNTSFQHSFYALQNQINLILGADFMTKQNAKIDLANSIITLNDEHFQLQPPPSRSTLVKLAETVFVPPFTSQDIAILLNKPPTTQHILIEPVSSLSHRHPGVTVAESLIATRNSLCRLVNDSNEPVAIPKGTVVGMGRNIAVNTLTETDDFIDLNKAVDPTSASEIDINNMDTVLPEQESVKLKNKLNNNLERFTTKDRENLGDHDEHIHPVSTGDNKANSQNYYRTAPKMQREIDSQIELLLKHGIIEPSRSEWRSPVVMVKKKDGTYRFACDYRRLNSLTEKQSYPMPKLEDVWDLIGETKPQYFSVLDLASGFWQIRMDPETKHKASFVTRSGQYTWNRLPFGLRNSPITFQQTMNDVLRDLIAKSCIVYVDDIIVFSNTFDEHLQHLQEVFDRLRKANLTLKFSKCKFAVQRVKYLGHILSPEGVLPDPEKVKIIQDWQPPTNPKQVRQFLGLANYYRRFVEKYSSIAKPLQNLTKKDEPWNWTEKCQKAFNILRNSLINPPCLAYPDMERPFILTTDASGVAISYILSQIGEDGVEHVISYAGRALRNAEVNYGITDKEGLAVIEGFNHFHTYLYGNKTTVYTDHQALAFINNSIKLTGRVARWAILLQNYNYTVIYKKGTENINADALSRVEVTADPNHDGQKVEDIETRHTEVFSASSNMGPSENTTLQCIFEYEQGLGQIPVKNELSQCEVPVIRSVNSVDLPAEQRKCPQIGPIYRYHKSGELPQDDDEARKIILHADQFGIFGEILHHIYEPRTRNALNCVKTIHQIVVPQSLQHQILSDYHDSMVGGGHQGFRRTFDSIREKYFWPRMYTDILEWQQSCPRCQRAKSVRQKPPPLHPLPVVNLFGRWHMDFIGPLRPAADGSKYILIVVDSFSRWPEAFALPNSDAHTVTRVLYSEIFTRYGAPGALVSDRGPQFMSSLVNALCEIFQVKRAVTSPYHPQSNAVCERFNSYLESSMRTYVNDNQGDWPSTLPAILMAYRHPPANRSTEFSPFYLLFGEPMKTPIDREMEAKMPEVSAQYRESMQSVIDNVKTSREIAHQNILRHQQENKYYHDRFAEIPKFELGDLVWLFHPKVPTGFSRKIRAQWVGPYNICELGPNHTYRLRHAHNRQTTDTLINANRLKLATATQESAIRMRQHRIQDQLRREREERQAPRDQNMPRHEVQPEPAASQPQQQPEDTDDNLPEEEPLPPVEKLVDIRKDS